MGHYIKRPIIVEAFEWRNDTRQEFFPTWMIEAINKNVVKLIDDKIYIATLEGTMVASMGDYIIRGVNCEIYPCKPDIFKKTYQETTGNHPGMTDKDFILFLIKVLWDDLTGGSPSDNDLETIRKELTTRGIDPDEVMPY